MRRERGSRGWREVENEKLGRSYRGEWKNRLKEQKEDEREARLIQIQRDAGAAQILKEV